VSLIYRADQDFILLASCMLVLPGFGLVSWFNLGGHLSTKQQLAHTPLVGWGTELEG